MIGSDQTQGNGESLPEGATIGAQGNGDPGVGDPLPEGATVGNAPAYSSVPASPTQPPQEDGAVGIGEGVLKGIRSSLSVGDKWAREHLPAALTNEWFGFGKPADVYNDQKNVAHGVAENIGYGGETLVEFMLGDEALKGLSMADKLAQVSKWMKIAEKSKRLIQAMKVGSAAVRASAELTPEEMSLVQKYPRLAALVGESLRLGTVQGTQTTMRTGDIEQGLKEGAEVGGLTFGTGAALNGAAHYLGKAKAAADTVAEMNGVAQNAPTKTAVEGGLADAVKGAYGKEVGTLHNQLDDATSQIGMYGEGAPGQSSITQHAQQYARATKQGVHNAYQSGLDQLVEMAGDNKLPYEGSPMQQFAQQIDQQGRAASGELDNAFNIGRPGSARANNIIDKLLKVGTEGEGGAAEPEVWYDETGHPDEFAGEHGPETPPEHQAQPAEMDMAHLVEYRQRISKLLRGLSRTSPDYIHDKEIYDGLLESADNSIGALADRVDEANQAAGMGDTDGLHPTEARNHFDQMNERYRQGIQPYNNRDVKNIMLGKLNDVAKSIMGGQTSLDDIDAVRKAVGPANFRTIGDASLRNIVQSFMDQQTGELNYKGLFQKFGKINPDVRQAMFGAQGEALARSLKAAADAKGGLDDIEKRIVKLLGSGDIDSILKNPEQARDIANTVGPDGMKVLGRSILESKISEASTSLEKGSITKRRFDPDKVLDWWVSMKDNPEVRDAFFSVDKESTKSYEDLMARLQQTSSVKTLVKYGVLPLALGATGAVHGPLTAVLGALGGFGTEVGSSRARNLLDFIANHPRTWKLLGWSGKVAETAARTTPDTSRAKDAAIKGVFHSLKGALVGSW